MQPTVLKMLLAAPLLLAAGHAQAQLTLGPRLGLNLANGQSSLHGNSQTGMQAGLTLNAPFGRLAVQPSVLFSQKGFGTQTEATQTLDGTSYYSATTTRVTLNYLDIPVNLVYTFGRRQGFQIFAGPYIGIGLSGRVKTGSTSQTKEPGGSLQTNFRESRQQVRFASTAGDDRSLVYFRSTNAGLNAGVGYKEGPLLLQAGYVVGLTNMVPFTESAYSYGRRLNDHTVQFSLTYLLGEGK